MSADPAAAACPLPVSKYDRVVMGHGSGGTLSAGLLRQVFLPAFANETLSALEDQAALALEPGGPARLAFTVDSFVVRPLFFPGGDIGRLAIHGTVNDLAVGGATPAYIAAAFILEEGFPIADLERVVASMRAACAEAGVVLVTGDTKVVERGKGDGVFVTTAGIGILRGDRALSVHAAKPGDRVLLSGTIGDHGIAILSTREGLEFEAPVESDSAPLHRLAAAVLDAAPGLRCMRDPTRGGLSSTLNEIAAASRTGIRIAESAVPVRPAVKAACELLGLDPLYVANEGKLVAVVPPEQAAAALAAMRKDPRGRDAADIGEVTADRAGMVVMTSRIGGDRVVTMLAGEQLPRIC
jgi:hydrogenase expression/formation protein HypE